ncbi:MAG: citramalate synthase [Oscillospiraceae bacterium]|jgi:2-isopropylmalate synthase|nr:citramalate synthase [Oscillospiraceae bacterium]
MAVAKKKEQNLYLAKKVEIYDTSLRDGAQSEGISYSNTDKLAIIQRLDDLGVHFIEAGNPSSNPKDAEFFKELQSSKLELKTAKIVAFGSTKKNNVLPAEDSGLKALLSAKTQRITIFGKSWDFHVLNVLNVSLNENITMIEDSVRYLTSKKRTVMFDAEHYFDGYKAKPDYALSTLKAALGTGAEGVILCDTNGGTFPDEVQRITRETKDALDKYILETNDGKKKFYFIGIHAHNDSDCAVANSIAAVQGGATQIQGTLLGYGERAGNAALTSVIPNLQLKLGVKCIADIKKITRVANEVGVISHYAVRDNTPYVGRSVFAHKAGMHADAVAKNSNAFEQIAPEEVGNNRKFLISEHSGKAAVAQKISSILTETPKDSPIVAAIVEKVKKMESEGYVFESADASFELMLRRETGEYEPYFELIDFKVVSSQIPNTDEVGVIKSIPSGAIVKVRVYDTTEITADEGDGPVNAIDKALRKALEIFYPDLKTTRLADYTVRIFDGDANTAAITRVEIKMSNEYGNWTTVGASKDIITASVIALSEAWEYFLFKNGKENYHANGLPDNFGEESPIEIIEEIEIETDENETEIGTETETEENLK